MAGKAGSAQNTMADLQVFQAKHLRSMDESTKDPAAFKELHGETDHALRVTKSTARAKFGRI